MQLRCQKLHETDRAKSKTSANPNVCYKNLKKEIIKAQAAPVWKILEN